jgi:hypothetical protein
MKLLIFSFVFIIAVVDVRSEMFSSTDELASLTDDQEILIEELEGLMESLERNLENVKKLVENIFLKKFKSFKLVKFCYN